MFDSFSTKFDLSTPEYDRAFWNSLRCREYDTAVLNKGKVENNGSYELPASDNSRFLAYLKEESLFRRIATVINVGKGDYSILAKDCNDLADWYAEEEEIPVYEGIQDFTNFSIGSRKLASFIKFDETFVFDASFNFRDHLLRRFARVMGRAEEKAFITGTSVKEPNGLLKPDSGAEIGVNTAALSYDDAVRLFFSLEPRYRERASWIMNDATALTLRTVKDDDGNYLWNHSDRTILGRPVVISNFMPDAEAGSIPLLFGDYSYYWIVCRRPFSIHTLYEKFAKYGQIGYLGTEFLDGRLIRPGAVKGLKITA